VSTGRAKTSDGGELAWGGVPVLARCTSVSSAICARPGRRCVSETPAKGGALWALGGGGRRRAVLGTRPRQAALSVPRCRSPRRAAPSWPWSVWWAHRVLRRVRAPRRGTAVGGARGGPPAMQEVQRGRAQSCLRVPRAGRTCGYKGARIWRCELIPRLRANRNRQVACGRWRARARARGGPAAFGGGVGAGGATYAPPVILFT
jgi:hypothetical protein